MVSIILMQVLRDHVVGGIGLGQRDNLFCELYSYVMDWKEVYLNVVQLLGPNVIAGGRFLSYAVEYFMFFNDSNEVHFLFLCL